VTGGEKNVKMVFDFEAGCLRREYLSQR